MKGNEVTQVFIFLAQTTNCLPESKLHEEQVVFKLERSFYTLDSKAIKQPSS